jgi:hypothetical protein
MRPRGGRSPVSCDEHSEAIRLRPAARSPSGSGSPALSAGIAPDARGDSFAARTGGLGTARSPGAHTFRELSPAQVTRAHSTRFARISCRAGA